MFSYRSIKYYLLFLSIYFYLYCLFPVQNVNGQFVCDPDYEREHLLQVSQSSSSSSSSSCQLTDSNGEDVPCIIGNNNNNNSPLGIIPGEYLLNGNIIFHPNIVNNTALEESIYAMQLFAQYRANTVSFQYRATNPRQWMKTFICIIKSYGFRGIKNITDNDWSDISSITGPSSAATTTRLDYMMTPMIIDLLGGIVSPIPPCQNCSLINCPHGCYCNGTCKPPPCQICQSGCENGCRCDGSCLPCASCPECGICSCNCVGVCNACNLFSCVTCSPSCASGCNCDGSCKSCATCSPRCVNGCNCDGTCISPSFYSTNCAECPYECDGNCNCQGQCPSFSYWDDDFSSSSSPSSNILQLIQTSYNSSMLKLYGYDLSNSYNITYNYSGAAGAGMVSDGSRRVRGNTNFATVLTFVNQVDDAIGVNNENYPQIWLGLSLITAENIDQDSYSQYTSFLHTPVLIGKAEANQINVEANFIADYNGKKMADAAMRVIGYLIPQELTKI